MSSPKKLKSVILKLLDYCQKEDWKGYDPYDALNSPIFRYFPFLNSRWPRIAFTQFFKRSPINFRPLLGIPKTENPKALALFLMSFIKLRKLGLLENDSLIDLMADKLINLRSSMICYSQFVTRNLKPETFNFQLATYNATNSNNPINSTNSINSANSINSTSSTNPYFCWGYSFPWQTRSILVPYGSPNIVCTTFVANSFLDLYEYKKDKKFFEIAKSAGEYILNELYWTDGNSISSFSYPLPNLKTIVYNANFLGSALLCRIYSLTGDKRFLDTAFKVARYSASKQNLDGSWYYGEKSNQKWIDNFHTGYNLCALYDICYYSKSTEFQTNIINGFKFYRNNFFLKDFVPKYFHNRIYPIDVHCIAQSIITLINLKDINKENIKLANSVFKWTIENMWNEKGYFYYQLSPFIKKKISYMRWSQSWMLFALSLFLENYK